MRLIVLAALALAISPGATAALSSILQNDAGSGGDAGDSQATATPLQNGGTPQGSYAGELVAFDDAVDWYSFNESGSGGPIHASVTFSVVGCTGVDDSVGAPYTARLISPTGETMAFLQGSGCTSSGDLHADAQSAQVARETGREIEGDGNLPEPFPSKHQANRMGQGGLLHAFFAQLFETTAERDDAAVRGFFANAIDLEIAHHHVALAVETKVDEGVGQEHPDGIEHVCIMLAVGHHQ